MSGERKQNKQVFRKSDYISFSDDHLNQQDLISFHFFKINQFLISSKLKPFICQNIIFLIKIVQQTKKQKEQTINQQEMQKKTHLLTDLKKQVLLLKNQLQNIERNRTNYHNRSSNSMNKSTLSQSSRFNTSTYDSTYLDRGVKKFALQQQKFKNLSQLITDKSKIDKQPNLSQYRRAEDNKTRQNFSTEQIQILTHRSKSPNPLTGQGYSDKKKGIKTKFQSKNNEENTQKSTSCRKHYPVYIYR